MQRVISCVRSTLITRFSSVSRSIFSIDAKSPTHSPNSADTRISRFLGSGRITGKPEVESQLQKTRHLVDRAPTGRLNVRIYRDRARKHDLWDAGLAGAMKS